MCPRCKSERISRSKKWRVPDLFMRLWGMRAYRCRECHSRFYLPTSLDHKITAERQWVKENENGGTQRVRKKRRTR